MCAPCKLLKENSALVEISVTCSFSTFTKYHTFLTHQITQSLIHVQLTHLYISCLSLFTSQPYR